MKKIMVTGGCGFIGSNFIRYLLHETSVETIVNVDQLTYAGNVATLQEFRQDPRLVFIRADIADQEQMNDIFQKHAVDAIINFAAESHVDRSIVDPQAFIRTNLLGTSTLLDGMKRYSIPKFIQISTDEVYGSLSFDAPAFREDNHLCPGNPYSASKASADLMVMAYQNTFGLNACITRCSNNYGPYQFPEKLIPLMILNAMQGKSLPVYGKGSNVRDWIHVHDHCRGIAAVLKKGRSGQIYHFGGRSERANIDVVKSIIREVDAEESLIEFVEDRPGHDLRYAMNIEQTVETLGWAPLVSFEEGLIQTVQWYKDNKTWWKPILSGEYTTWIKEWYAKGKGC